MKYLALLILLTFTTPVFGQASVKDYVDFEKAKLVTYAEATQTHLTTHKPVIVWVGVEDFDAWEQTKDLGIHCFSKDFPGLSLGVVVGGDQNGEYKRLADIKANTNSKVYVDGIQDALNPKPKTRTESPSAAAVSAPPVFFTLPYYGSTCANGQCGR